MNVEPNQRQILALLLGLLLAATLVLLFIYVRQRLFTQTEPIVLAS